MTRWRGDAPPGRGRPAAGAGRAAGQGLGAHLAGRPARLDGSSALQAEWTARIRARWAAHRAAASETGGDGGAWLDGDAAGAIACDAAMAPIVTGDVDPACWRTWSGCAWNWTRRRGRRGAGTAGRAALEQAVIGKAVDLLSGPGGLASLPAAAAARRPAGGPEPAAGHRVLRDYPGGDPQRGDPAGPALPVGRAVRRARRGLRSAPCQHKANGGPTASKTASCSAASTIRS